MKKTILKGVLTPILVITISGCLNSKPDPRIFCQYSRNNPRQKLQDIQMRAGQQRSFCLCEVFHGVTAPNSITNVSLTGEGRFVHANVSVDGGLILTANRRSPETDDTVTISVNTKCGPADATITVHLVPGAAPVVAADPAPVTVVAAPTRAPTSAPPTVVATRPVSAELTEGDDHF